MSKAERLGFKEIVVRFDVYEYDLYADFGPWANLTKLMRWRYGDNLDFGEASRGKAIIVSGHCPSLWMPRPPRTPREYGTLAHEIIHAVRHMFEDHIGMRLSDTSEEAYCHAIGHAMTRILEGLRK